jgi:hypothetical protein
MLSEFHDTSQLMIDKRTVRMTDDTDSTKKPGALFVVSVPGKNARL